MILMKDQTSSRMWSRWKAPATVVEVKSPHSYIVEYDGTRYHLHANKLRRFEMRVSKCNVQMNTVDINACSVIFEEDDDFGEGRPH